ncbi:MAG: spermidine/putrescine ABC transporter substrate-binding protein [Elusimicrobiota bacterium]|jgi:spermidine/putrescine-binding protein|nr:spermidine/putrescine ABC transporter substrate-binding protein [Elusimicrobiota bacterium]
MKKKTFCRLIFAMTLIAAGFGSVFLSGCKSSNSQGEVNVFVWEDYLPESVINQFEKETGIKVNAANYISNEDMLAKIKSSKENIYDIAVPSDYMVELMKGEDMLLEYDTKSLENFKNLDENYLNLSFDRGNKFSVPYMAGGAMIIVNKNQVKDKITSFADLLNPKYKSSIVVLDDFRAVIGAMAKSLGYSFNVTNDKELAIVEKYMEQLKPNLKLRDSSSPKTPMIGGETSIGYIWSGEIALCLMEKPDEFEVIYPKEGIYLFVDNLVILKNAKNVENAKKFINFILRPDISAMISAEHPYPNPNKAAVALLPDSFKKNPAANIPPEVLKKGEFIKNLKPNDLEKYDLIWTKFTK